MIISQVADEYHLTGDARKLLFVIRIVENGGPGKEMGVLTPEAQRYKGDHSKSLKLQAQWAAGTIKKRYDGSMERFASRYCPPSSDPIGYQNWIKNATAYMQE